MNEMANSVRQLAKAVGRSHTAVARWIEHPLWDQGQTGPFDVERARRWAATHLQRNPADEYVPEDAPVDPLESLRRNPLSAAKLKLTLTRAAKLELERGILAGEYLPRRDVEDALVKRVHAVRGALQSLPRQVAGTLVGQSEVEIENLLDDAIRAVLADLASQSALPQVET